MADEEQEATIFEPAIHSNGITADTSDEDLLAELSAETVGKSYGYVKVKLTRGEEKKYIKLKIQPVDVIKISQQIERIPKKVKSEILEQTAAARSIGFDDENWLQSLATFVEGLAPPHLLRDRDGIAWEAGKDNQDLPRAMLAVVQAGFHFWHVNDVSSAVVRLTRDANQDDLLPNS